MLAKNLILLFVFAVIAGSLYYSEVHIAEQRAEEERREKLFFDIDKSEVESFTLSPMAEHGSERLKIEIQRGKDFPWLLTHPVNDRANKIEVERLLAEVTQLQKTKKVVENAVDLSEFALDEPLSKISWRDDEGKDYELHMGRRSPVGYKTYVRPLPGKSVYLVNASIESYLKKKVPDLRRRKLFDIKNRRDIKNLKLSFQNGDSIELKNANGTWLAVEPFPCELHQGAVDKLADSFRDIRVDYFIKEKCEDPVNYGFDDPSLVLRANVRGRSRDVELVIGKASTGKVPGNPKKDLSGWYVRSNLRDTVYVIAKYQKEKLHKKFNSLRDRTVCPNVQPGMVESLNLVFDGKEEVTVRRDGSRWMASGAAKFRCDKLVIERVIDAVSDLKVSSFIADKVENKSRWGLDRPKLSVSIDYRAEDKEPLALSFDWQGKERVHVAIEGRDSVYGVDGDILLKLPDKVVSLLTKRLFGIIDKNYVKEIRIDAVGLEPICLGRSKKEDVTESWKLLRPVEKSIEQKRADEWMLRFRSIKAREYMQKGRDENLLQYGLSSPLAELTLVPKEAEAEEFWIKIGSITKDKLYHYAICSTRDAVFKLKRRDAKLILAPSFVDTATVLNIPKKDGSSLYKASEQELQELPRALVKTTKGSFEMILFRKDAPNTVGNFMVLAKRGFYDGTTFHRVKEFCIQGGDPNTKDDDPDNDGKGGPGYTIPDEISTRRKHHRGRLSMAHRGANTGGSQFFVTKTKAPWLDGVHTVFGAVIEGMDVVDKVEKGTEVLGIEIKNDKGEKPKIQKNED